MKKNLSFLLFIFLFTQSYAQDIKENKFDQFTKQQRVKTKKIVLKSGLSCGINLIFRSVDSTFFVIMEGYGCAVGVVGEMDDAIFLMKNDSVIRVQSTGIQSYQIGRPNDYYTHQYRISKERIFALTQQPIKAIRRYYNSNYQDIEIPESNTKKVMTVADSFLKAVSPIQ